MPPEAPEEAVEDWVDKHPQDAIAYAAGWTQSGQGYGPIQAKKDWPDCPGFDWMEGLPDWETDLEEEDGFEYRTVLVGGDAYGHGAPDVTPDGFELVKSYAINPEPEVYGEDGSPTGHAYVGEGNAEVVYRRALEDDEPSDYDLERDDFEAARDREFDRGEDPDDGSEPKPEPEPKPGPGPG